jgi:hypothetical protein
MKKKREWKDLHILHSCQPTALLGLHLPKAISSANEIFAIGTECSLKELNTTPRNAGYKFVSGA